MHSLKFVIPRGLDLPVRGLFTTVRCGNKWKDLLNYGDKVNIVVCKEFHKDCSCPSVGRAYIMGIQYCSLFAITNNALNLAHDPSCREFEGLLKRLQEIYGDLVNHETYVTVLYLDFTYLNYKPN